MLHADSYSKESQQQGILDIMTTCAFDFVFMILCFVKGVTINVFITVFKLMVTVTQDLRYQGACLTVQPWPAGPAWCADKCRGGICSWRHL